MLNSSDRPFDVLPSDVMPLDVLIVSERPDHLRSLIRVLDASSARISACFTIRQAQEIFSRQSVDVVFCDEHLSDGSYRELLQASRFPQNAASFVLLLRTGAGEEYLDAIAMRLGALDVLRCPLQPADVEAAAQRTIAQKQERRAARLAAEIAKAGAGGPTQQDLLFDQLLNRAAAALNPESPSARAAPAVPKPSDHRPTVVRRDLA